MVKDQKLFNTKYAFNKTDLVRRISAIHNDPGSPMITGIRFNYYENTGATAGQDSGATNIPALSGAAFRMLDVFFPQPVTYIIFKYDARCNARPVDGAKKSLVKTSVMTLEDWIASRASKKSRC